MHIIFPKLDEIVRKNFKFENSPSLLELERKAVLMFTNNNFAFDVPEPTNPNVIPIGGLQILDPKPLSEVRKLHTQIESTFIAKVQFQDLKTFIEKGKKGTVLMALGTNMKSIFLGEEKLISIIEAFKEMPDYNFIFKFEADTLPTEKPKNVMISKFLPQNDILAHPNIKAFISHSGMSSTFEALWRGKPVVSIPFFVDQHRVSDIRRVVKTIL